MKKPLFKVGDQFEQTEYHLFGGGFKQTIVAVSPAPDSNGHFNYLTKDEHPVGSQLFPDGAVRYSTLTDDVPTDAPHFRYLGNVAETGDKQLYVIPIWDWHNNCDVAEEPFNYTVLAEDIEKAKKIALVDHMAGPDATPSARVEHDDCFQVDSNSIVAADGKYDLIFQKREETNNG